MDLGMDGAHAHYTGCAGGVGLRSGLESPFEQEPHVCDRVQI